MSGNESLLMYVRRANSNCI